MSEIVLSIIDAERSIHARVHGAEGDRIVAALAADPETIVELGVALGRFCRRSEERGFFHGWHGGVCHEPWDAGIVFVDLAARLVASRSAYSSFGHRGGVEWHDGQAATDRVLPFHLAGDWLLVEDVAGFEHLSSRRRAERRSAPPLDARSVIYGRLAEFIVREVHARQNELGELGANARYDFARDIHIRWLLAPRDDLGGRCPRELVIDDRHDHITWDLQYQGHRWSLVGEPPPGIARESSAYRFGGFGTHEIVLYYDLVRELLHECIGRLATSPVNEVDLLAEAEHLQQFRQEWMNGPKLEDLHGRTPSSLIDRERRRLPECVSSDEAIIDHHCPLCQMMADERFGPTFWNLDGSSMDWDFAFSFHRTREEWEKDERDHEEWSRKFNEDRKRDQSFIDGRTPAHEFLEVDDAKLSVWQTSYSNQQATDELPAADALPLMLFGIGAHLGELGEDLARGADDGGAEHGRSLRSHFTELRRAIDDRNPWLAESAVAHFSEELSELSTTRPELAAKCADLEGKLDRLLQRCREVRDLDDRLPF